jgi:hypothetical protein
MVDFSPHNTALGGFLRIRLAPVVVSAKELSP